MSLLRINSSDHGLELHRSAQQAGAALGFAARQMRGTAPVVFMVHGYKFAPADPRHCPHDHIFSTRQDHPCWKAMSWPRGLGATAPEAQMLGIAFGWPARGSLRRAYARAQVAGQDLAEAVRIVRRAAPERPIHILTHSLGARVAFSALAALEAGDICRVVMLTAAEFTGAARTAATTPCGRATEMLHITSRENALFDHLLRWGMKPPAPRDLPMGLGGSVAQNVAQIHLHHGAVLHRLATMGYPIADPARRVCHWSVYLREGVWPFYRALVETPDQLPFGVLRGLEHLGAAPAAPVPGITGPHHLPV